MDQQNPYAAPQAGIAAALPQSADRVTVTRVEAIIKDAGQFWLAILMCIFCTGLGAIIIGPWYFVRLLQWHAIARAQPMLVDPHVPHGSLAQRFQAARTRLIIGMSFGGVVLLLLLVLIITTIASEDKGL